MSDPGSQTKVKLENNLYFTSGTCNGTTEVGVSNYTLSQAKLYVFNAGYTASGTSNICTVTRNHGAKAVLGWIGGMITSDSTKWQQRFQLKCRSGYSLSSAINYADSFIDYEMNSVIKNHQLYGNYTQTITWTGSSSVGNEPDRDVDDREVSIDTIECSYNNVDNDAIADTISAYAPDFDMSDYEISAVSTSDDNTSFVVDVIRKVGDFDTSCGYTFIFHDEKADVMYDNTNGSQLELSRNSLALKSAKADTNADAAYDTAAKGIDEGYYITDQFITKYCDIETGIFYNKVYSECKEINGDCYYSYSTLAPIV